jgi:hypothetical protein
MSDDRWCHTVNVHEPHNYGSGLHCNGTSQKLYETFHEYWEGGEVKPAWKPSTWPPPTDPTQRLLWAQERLRKARTDLERIAAMRECEEAVAIKDEAARRRLDVENAQPAHAAKKRKAAGSWSWKKEALWQATFLVVATLTTMAAGNGLYSWLWCMAAFEIFMRLLPIVLKPLVRARPAPEREPTAEERRASLADGLRPTEPSELEGEALEWAAYQVSIGLGLDTAGWMAPPRLHDEVRFEHKAGPVNRWRGTITNIKFDGTGVPQYTCIAYGHRSEECSRIYQVTIDQMEPYK